jgi:RNA polymerase sigma-70 factor (ECF subfamily)
MQADQCAFRRERILLAFRRNRPGGRAMVVTATPPETEHAGCEAEDLVRRIVGGEANAEDELVDRYGRRVRSVIASAHPDPATAEDLFQETFRIGLEKVRGGRLREAAKLGAFLAALARCLAIDDFRRLAARRSNGTLDEDVPDPGPDPADRALLSERAEKAWRVLGRLGARDRAVLTRFYVAGDDKDALCRELGLSRLHFNRVLFRARERYRALYLADAGA